jgi:integrase
MTIKKVEVKGKARWRIHGVLANYPRFCAIDHRPDGHVDARQMQALIEHLPRTHRLPVELSVLTLLRLRELLSLRRGDVDLRTGVIHLQTAHGWEAVILGARARQLLETQLTSHSHTWVFPGRSAGRPVSVAAVLRQLRTAAHAAAMANIGVHDLQRSVLRIALDAGIPVRVLRQLARYSVSWAQVGHMPVTEAELRDAADLLARAVFDAHP